MKKATIGSVIALMLSILVTSSILATEKETPASFLTSVDTLNGVDKNEAENIAKAYFLINVGCGVFDYISEEKENWVVEGFFGYAGQPIKGFLINKQSGSIISPVGPDYDHPQDMLIP